MGDPNVELLEKGQVLHIKSARMVDKGHYQCSATNAAGKQIKEVKLIIHGEFIQSLIQENPSVLHTGFLNGDAQTNINYLGIS